MTNDDSYSALLANSLYLVPVRVVSVGTKLVVWLALLAVM